MILDKLLEEWLQVSGPWEYALERDGEGEAAANLANLRKRTRALAAEQPENSQQVGIVEREVAYWKQEFYRVEKMVEAEQDRVEELERQLAAAEEEGPALPEGNEEFSQREAKRIVNSADAQCFRWLLKHHSGFGKAMAGVGMRCWIGGIEFIGDDVATAILDAIDREEAAAPSGGGGKA